MIEIVGDYMRIRLLYILSLLLLMGQGAWATTVNVSTYAELRAAIDDPSVNIIIVTADIDVPCETSVTNKSNPDYTGASTAQLVIGRSLTLQSQAGSRYTIKRVAADGATNGQLKSLFSIRGDGSGTSGTANLSGNTVEVTFTNIIIDGGAVWGNSAVDDRRKADATAYGNAGRSMIDVFMGGTLNLEDGAELQNGFTTYSINSVVNNTGSDNYGGAVRVEYDANYGGGTVNLKAGATIHDCSARGGDGDNINTHGYGGALGAYNFANLNVYGGTIYNCSAANGGAIGCTWRTGSTLSTAGKINLYGGTIHHCYANKGGAIITEGEVEDYLLGGSISNCTATTSGGAIAITEKNTKVHIVDSSSEWLTISNCSPVVEGSEGTGGYPSVYVNPEATNPISTTPVYQVTFRNNNTDFAVLHVLQGNSLGEAFPAAPVNAGLRFLGWYNGDTQVTSSTAINDNITVTAKWDFLGSGTEVQPYQIPSADVWNFLADKVSAGNTYYDKYFRQTEDISVSTMVGATSSHKFSGTYDGAGHTLTVNYNSTTQYAAPFSYANGATFKNLHIAGSITSSAKYVASFVGYSYGSNTFLNCRSSVAITSSISGDGTHGGFVGILEGDDSSYYTVTFEGCVFNGKLLGSNTTNCGGFVGWSQTHRKIRINLSNCLYAPQEVTISISGCQTFSRGQVLSDIFSTNTNNYYIESLGGTQGKQACSISAGDDVTINNLGEGTEYNVSGITAYAHGIKYGGTYYAGDGDAVSLSLSHEDKAGYTFNQYSVTGGGTLANPITNSPTLTMTDANQTINVEWAFNTLTFNYTGDVQTFTVPVTGYYKLECYGAQGGYSSSGLGGKGGLSQLTYPLTQGDVLYIYVGGQGECIDGSSHPEGGDGGWNGGGKGGTGVQFNGQGTPYNGGGGGGGATHIATSAIGPISSETDFTSNHTNLLLIAGGGGGGLSWGSNAGGAGGGTEGRKGRRNGEWNIAWNNGTLSCGKDGMTSSTGAGSAEGCGGGGGGYVGGNTWVVQYNEQHQCYSGAGGSSWGDETNGMNYSTTAGGATDGGNGKAQITFLIQGSGIEEDPYLISSEADWNYLAAQVNSGNSYSDKLVRLANDISVTTMVGNSVDNSFRGTFDGDGHTLTISYSNNSDFTAPFRYIQGATFKNLKVTGSITTTMNLAAGIAGLNTNAAATFEQCVTDVTINSSSTTVVGWGRVDYHGGFLARTNSANVNLTDCVCGGSVNGSNGASSTSYCAGFVGVAVSCTVTGTRCLNTTYYTNVSITNSLCHTADATRSVDVFYYVNGNDGACPGTPVTTSQLADGSIFTALEAACTESVWAQDPITNQPMLKMFANDGKLPGEFTINAGGGKVNFSHGNLQYQANSTGAASAPYTGVWRFAANQYEAIGSGNSNVSASYGGWIDFFGWGSGNQPTQTSEDPNTYSSFVDWGTNVISNGGNTANLWRTLSESEWTYIISTRPNASNKRGRATINGMYCYVLLPDDWVLPSGLSFTPDANNWTNVYTVEQWAQMEAAGAVCLPASGSRAGGANNTNVNDYNHWGCYWSSTSANSTQGYNLWFTPDYVGTTDKGNYKMGASVRLVYEAPLQGTGTEQDPYLISSEADWYYLANKVNNGNDYSGKFFRQTADISVTTMVGVSDLWSFSGTYDGDGKTMNLNLNTLVSHTAPFRYIVDATIKNVITTGTVHSTNPHLSGLVGIADGTCTIQNCQVSADVGGAEYSGGIVGHCWHANISIIGCVYSGTLSPVNNQYTGGIIGWGGDGGGHTISISNCLFAGSVDGSTHFHPIGTLFDQDKNAQPNTKSLSNTYYTLGAQNITDDDNKSFVKGLTYQGKFARTISAAGDDVTISGLGAASATYDVSDITAYAHGIKYGSDFYAGDGDEVSLTLSHGEAEEGYIFGAYNTSSGTLSGSDNPYTLTMPASDVTISATWKKLLSNTDITIADIPSQTYDGTALTPVITVTDGTTPLTQGTDYTVSPETATNTGEYEVTITGIGNYDGTATKTFTIVPQVTNYGAATITWDQTGKTATLDGVSDLPCNITVETNVNHAVLNRTFTSGKKVTICLPFVVTAEQAATLGTFYDFSGVTGEGQIEMTQVTSDLTAHTPYIFEPSSGRTTFDFGEKTILTGSPLTTSFYGLKFKGIYDRVKWTANNQDALYNADRAAELGKAYGFALQDMTVGTKTYEVGQFVKLGDGVHSRAFRAYLLYDGTWDGNQPTNPASSAPRRSDVTLPDVIEIVWKDADGNVTGISALDTRCGEMADYGTDWYTVDGRKLDGKPATKGLYINNGRKVVVK